MVITAISALRARRPAEFTGKEDDCLIEETAAGEIFKESADRLIDGEAQPLVVGLKAAVGVPGPGAPSAVLDLDKAHAPLHKPPRGEQLHAEIAAVGEVEAVEPLRFLRLVGEVDNLRHAVLHAEGEFVGGDAGGCRRIVGIFDGGLSVEMADEIEADPLGLGREGTLRMAKVEGIGGINPQRHRVMRGAKIHPVLAVPVLAGADGDELWKIVVYRPESVVHPATERRLHRIEHVAAGVELRLRSVVGIGRPHRSDDGDPVGVPRGVREEIADLHAALPMPAETGLERIEDIALQAVGVGNGGALKGEFRRVLDVGIRSLGDRLAGMFCHLGLVVKAFKVADAAIHKQPDDALRLWGEVRSAVGGKPGSGGADAVAGEHGTERQTGEAEAKVGKSFTSIKRVDRRRALNITADVNKLTNNPTVVREAVRPFIEKLLADHPHISWSYEGEARSERESQAALLLSSLLVLFGLYGLMAIPFKSYTQPFIVLLVIPFGVVGATLGHVFHSMPLSLMSLCGILACSGVIVNDTLVLVDRINELRDETGDTTHAATEGGASRFRAIFLTQITTFVGLMPLIFNFGPLVDHSPPIIKQALEWIFGDNRSAQATSAQFLTPMSVAMGYGSLFATLITLYLVPMCYLVLEDLMRFVRRLFGLLRFTSINDAAEAAA